MMIQGLKSEISRIWFGLLFSIFLIWVDRMGAMQRSGDVSLGVCYSLSALMNTPVFIDGHQLLHTQDFLLFISNMNVAAFT